MIDDSLLLCGLVLSSAEIHAMFSLLSAVAAQAYVVR
jgi:hypothetical protein